MPSGRQCKARFGASRARGPASGHAQLAKRGGHQRLQRIQRLRREGRDLGPMHGMRPKEVQRPLGQPPQLG